MYELVSHMERTICFVFISCGISDESFASKQFPEESLWELNRRITHILGFCNCECFLVVSVLWTDKCIDDCCKNVMFSYLATVVMGRIWHVFGLWQPRWLLKSILRWSMTCMIFGRLGAWIALSCVWLLQGAVCPFSSLASSPAAVVLMRIVVFWSRLVQYDSNSIFREGMLL